MDDVTRRQAIKVAAAGAVATGAVGLGLNPAAAQDEAKATKKAGAKEAFDVTLLSRIQIVCKNIVGAEACLFILEENNKFYLEATYRGRSAKLQIAEGEQTILSVGVVTFKLKISELSIQGKKVSARLQLVAKPIVGSEITIINEKVSVTIPGRDFAVAADAPVQDAIVLYGDDAK